MHDAARGVPREETAGVGLPRRLRCVCRCRRAAGRQNDCDRERRRTPESVATRGIHDRGRYTGRWRAA